jgi:hypothetical protein
LVELDQLERCYPPLGQTRVMVHLAMLSGSYREAGYELLLVSATVEDDSYREAVFAPAGGDEQMLVRLEAERAT